MRWGACPVVRTRDSGRALTALELALSEACLPGDSEVRLECRSLLVPGRGMVLLPREIDDHVDRLDRALSERGLPVVDARTTIVDVSSGEVVVRSGHALNRDRLAAFFDGPHRGRKESFVEPGRFPLAGVLSTSTSVSVGRFLVASIGRMNVLSPSTMMRLRGVLSDVPWRSVSEWRPSVVVHEVNEF